MVYNEIGRLVNQGNAEIAIMKLVVSVSCVGLHRR